MYTDNQSNIEQIKIQNQYKFNFSKKFLIGEWKLESFTQTSNGKTFPWREKVSGLLIYTKKNYVSVSINGDKDVEFYSGMFKLSSNKNIIYHFVENATDFEKIGKTLIREAIIIDYKTIILISKKTNPERTFELKWVRI